VVYTAYMSSFLSRVAVAATLATVSGCGSGSSPASSTAKDAAVDAPALPAALAVTADWEHHTLSLVDFDALVSQPAGEEASARVGTIDLSKYTQGPYTVKITPDGKTALVTLSAGFFTVPGATILVNASSITMGPSELLFVDLASRSIDAVLDTGDGATGIAITHDGTRAFVAHAATSMVSIVDVKAHKVLEQVDVGGTFAEEVALDDTDTVGIVTYLDPTSSSKNVRTFAVSDMASTLSPPIPLGSDAAGVPFFPGTKVAYVVLAYNPLTSPASGYALVDATNPMAPVKLVQTMWTDMTYVDYQAIPAPGRGTVLVPVAVGGRLAVREYALGTADVVLQKTYDVAATRLFGAFGAVLDGQGRLALTMPGDREVAVLDLGTGASFTVPWFTEPGPLGVALR
jgi:DNA-binding beta-propeller fold protein YncE